MKRLDWPPRSRSSPKAVLYSQPTAKVSLARAPHARASSVLPADRQACLFDCQRASNLARPGRYAARPLGRLRRKTEKSHGSASPRAVRQGFQTLGDAGFGAPVSPRNIPPPPAGVKGKTPQIPHNTSNRSQRRGRREGRDLTLPFTRISARSFSALDAVAVSRPRPTQLPFARAPARLHIPDGRRPLAFKTCGTTRRAQRRGREARRERQDVLSGAEETERIPLAWHRCILPRHAPARHHRRAGPSLAAEGVRSGRQRGAPLAVRRVRLCTRRGCKVA